MCADLLLQQIHFKSDTEMCMVVILVSVKPVDPNTMLSPYICTSLCVSVQIVVVWVFFLFCDHRCREVGAIIPHGPGTVHYWYAKRTLHLAHLFVCFFLSPFPVVMLLPSLRQSS